VLPASGHAAVIDFGSDLQRSATIVEDHGADSAFWNVGNPGGAAPADGQITQVAVKGGVVADPSGRIKPNPFFHFQVLHPVGGGQVKVMLSSAGFFLPVTPNPQTISTFRPVNLCVHQGDYVDFNDIGGFQFRWGAYQGMPFQVFASNPDASTNFYTADNGTNVGTQWAPQRTTPGEELLMRTTLATGPDSTDFCPGGFAGHVFQGLKISKQTRVLNTGSGIVNIKTVCPGPSYGGCRGVLILRATLGGKPVTLGGATFIVKQAYGASLSVRLSKANVKLVRQAKSVVATVSADAKDDPSSDSRAKPGVPVQSKSTSRKVTIKPDR
jgi:hypothetical protein